ncbi:MAG: hypothetical protein GY719_39420 [bacterium]|nr:hypothetical protein [bacterium]
MPSEVPNGWSWERLSYLGNFHKGRGGSKKDERETGFPVVRYGELYTQHHDVIRSFHSYISPERAEDYTPLRQGDVLFAGSGETLDEIGKSATFLGPEPAHASGDIIIFRPGVRVDPLFLGYASNGVNAVEQKKRMGQGSSVMHIYTHNLEKLEVPVPPLPEQKKIAAILSSVDEAIQAKRAVIEQTRRVKEGLLQDLLTKGIGHTRFKQTEIGEIPEGWKLSGLGSYLPKGSVQNGLYKPASDYGDGGLPIIRIDSFQHGGRVDLSRLRRVNVDSVEADRFLVKDDDILLNRVNSLSHLAKSAIVEGIAQATVFESNMMRVRLETDLGLRPAFLIAVLSLPYAWNHFQLNAKKAVAQASVNQGDLRALPVPVPPPDEQSAIAARLLAVDEKVRAGERSIEQLQQVKAGLLQDLLTGKVRVTV